jgi:4-amino-4-deoxy-L-arabinose transferase-like glycosyltransferase
MTGGAAPASWLERWLRPGATSRRDVVVDVLWLIGLALLLMGAGLGLRDPWPADEPRFALVARDMLRSGDWLIPRVGGDLYADKPPVFFWLMAASMALTGSMRVGFLLPSLLAGVGVVALVYDLLRRVRGREVAFAGALLLMLTFQFTWQARQAQIDATLCFLTTLSLYGLLRHLFAGPAIGWFFVGWAAAGFGVITKGVGFLPLLLLVPFAVLRERGWEATASVRDHRWWLGPVFFLGAVGIWFVPMMLATSAGGELLAYRNEILFQQTVTRYAGAWHHQEPAWYYFTNVIPALWLPLIALVPWLWPRWRRAFGSRDTFVVTLLAWVGLVLLFFSASAGKRGVYVLPAVPALAMAAAPWLPELLLRRPGTRKLAFALAATIASGLVLGTLYFLFATEATARAVERHGLAPALPLGIAALVAVVAVAAFRVRDGWLAYGATFGGVLLSVGLVAYPRIDALRSGRAFMHSVAEATRNIEQLGLVGAKEQYLLELARPSFNFGHARWREREQEAADAAAWLVAEPGRALLIDGKSRALCFAAATPAIELGRANRQKWFVVTGTAADPGCIARGDLRRARMYIPPNASINSAG